MAKDLEENMVGPSRNEGPLQTGGAAISTAAGGAVVGAAVTTALLVGPVPGAVVGALVGGAIPIVSRLVSSQRQDNQKKPPRAQA